MPHSPGRGAERARASHLGGALGRRECQLGGVLGRRECLTHLGGALGGREWSEWVADGWISLMTPLVSDMGDVGRPALTFS